MHSHSCLWAVEFTPMFNITSNQYLLESFFFFFWLLKFCLWVICVWNNTISVAASSVFSARTSSSRAQGKCIKLRPLKMYEQKKNINRGLICMLTPKHIKKSLLPSTKALTSQIFPPRQILTSHDTTVLLPTLVLGLSIYTQKHFCLFHMGLGIIETPVSFF